MMFKWKCLFCFFGVIVVNMVVGIFYFFDQVFDGFGFRLLFFDRYFFFFEYLFFRYVVGVIEMVKGSEELVVVDFEVRVVKGVVGSIVDNGVVVEVFVIVDEDGLEVDEDEEEDVDLFFYGEEEGENVVWQILEIIVDGMESVVGEGSGYNLFVVSFVKVFVDVRVVQVVVNLVDVEVVEDDEGGELEDVLLEVGVFFGGVVEFVVVMDFGEEDGGVEDGYDGYGFVGLDDFELDLVFDVFGVVEGVFVEDELVGQ